MCVYTHTHVHIYVCVRMIKCFYTSIIRTPKPLKRGKNKAKGR